MRFSTPKVTDAKLPGPVAYLTGEYPKVSHTFILREIEEVRSQGVDVISTSIRKPSSIHFKGLAEAKAYKETFYVIRSISDFPLKTFIGQAQLFAQNPLRCVKVAWLAFTLSAPGLKALIWQIFYLVEAGVLARHLIDRRARHLHNHFGDSSCTVAMLASRLANIPYSFTVHGPDDFFRPFELGLTHKIEGAKFVVAISKFCRSQLMLFSKRDSWKKIFVVHCGISLSRYGSVTRGKYSKKILFIGRLDGVKGAFLLMEAFCEVVVKHPDARLTFVGDGSERASLEAYAADMEIDHLVEFTGFLDQNEVAQKLDVSDIFVLPSFAEGLPCVLMEAGAARLPSIATQIAGVSELVQDGVTGFIVPPSDVDMLAQRIDYLLNNPDICRKFGSAAREVVESEFSIGSTAENLTKLFDE